MEIYLFYKNFPFLLQKVLEDAIPQKKMLCAVCTKKNTEDCEKTQTGIDPKIGFCGKFDPPKTITFERVMEVANSGRITDRDFQ